MIAKIIVWLVVIFYLGAGLCGLLLLIHRLIAWDAVMDIIREWRRDNEKCKNRS